MEKLKVGIIIPDRGDRPDFLENCKRMIKNQTYNDVYTYVVNFFNSTNEVDITKRYKKGYELYSGRGFDCLLLMENDDYYAPDYIETMLNKWVEIGKPDLLGTNYTIYYHLGTKKHFTMHHKRRASAMNTLIKPDLNFDWCKDNDPYTDLHLWMRCGLKGITFKPEKIISIGMKHGVGMCGGRNHVDYLNRYVNDDSELNFLKENIDQPSFEFYKQQSEKWQLQKTT